MGVGFIEISDLITGGGVSKILETDLSKEEVRKFVVEFGRYAVISRKYSGPVMITELKDTLEEDYDLLDVQTVVLLEEGPSVEELEVLSESEAVVGVILMR